MDDAFHTMEDGSVLGFHNDVTLHTLFKLPVTTHISLECLFGRKKAQNPKNMLRVKNNIDFHKPWILIKKKHNVEIFYATNTESIF